MTGGPLLSSLAIDTGLLEEDIVEIARDAPKKYKVYQIPKKSGGFRTIAHPARELKLLQRALTRLVIAKLPVHPSATAYRIGTNIADNAFSHSGQNPVMKLDFSSFFNSIRVPDWVVLAGRSNMDLTREDIALTSKLLFWGAGGRAPYCLSVGAPSSPNISNAIMYDFDKVVASTCMSHDVIYTRYADDITLSAPDIHRLVRTETFIRRHISKIRSPKLKINEEKRGIYSAGQRRMVTGLILTPQGTVSIGRNRKREISSLVHKYSLGDTNREKTAYLKGMLGFAIANEGDFVSRLRRKYGDDIVDDILREKLPRRRLVRD